MNGKSSFILYHEFREPLEGLTNEQRGKLLMALFSYSVDGVAPSFDDNMVMITFAFIKNAMDRDAAAWTEKCEKRRQAGARGGKAYAENLKQSQADEAETPSDEQNRANGANAQSVEQNRANGANAQSVEQNRANGANAQSDEQNRANGAEHEHEHEHDHDHEHEHVHEHDHVHGKENGGEKRAAGPPQKRFVPPSVEEVAAYCRERGNGIDPRRFMDFYEANGWVQGKGKPIKSWQAAVRTWERGDRDGRAADRGVPENGAGKRFNIRYDVS